MSRKLNRVVITGIGSVSCFGVGAKYAWKNVLAARSGISSIKEALYPKQPCRVYGKVPTTSSVQKQQATSDADFKAFEPDKYASKSQQREMGLVGLYALASVDEALNDAQWHPKTDEEKHQSGIILGTAFSDYQFISDSSTDCQQHGNYQRLSPFFGPRLILNMPAARASIRYGLKAVQSSPTTACATGTHSIGDGFRMIRAGACEVIVAGGVEAGLNAMTFAGLSKTRALSKHFNDQPERASRPFDASRDGFVMSEGGAALVIESLDHFNKRVRSHKSDKQPPPQIYAEILGYGVSADGYHVTSPAPDGGGMRRCMQAALRDAELSPSDITHINCHATATPAGDVAEARAMCSLLASAPPAAGQAKQTVFVNSTKGATGHMVSAAGAIESIFTALACRHNVIAPCTNLTRLDPTIGEMLHNLQKQTGRTVKMVGAENGRQCDWKTENGARRIALKNSFGFGGTNASICIASYCP